MTATLGLFPPPPDEKARLERDRLIKRLTELQERRGDHHELAIELDLQSGRALLEVYSVEGFTFREAAQLLGISRPTGYRLMEEARKAAR